MAFDEALQELEASLSRPSSTPCTWRPDRAAYIAEMTQALRSHLIDPIPVLALASDWAQRWVNQPARERDMLAIARDGDTWLLYDPETKQFAKAFGSDAKSTLSLLGFASGDALAEWLG